MFWIVIIVLAIIFFIWLGKSKPAIELKGNGSFDYEIVGESNYQRNIRKALNLNGQKSSKSFKVRLEYEDHNKHADKAVAVYIGSRKVGYLSRGKARSYRKMMKNIGMSKRDAECYATVYGGGNKKSYGIFLDFDSQKTKRIYNN